MPGASVLHVEDDPNDALLVEYALCRALPHLKLLQVSDCAEAFKYLLGASPYHDRTQFPMPDLIIVDLKMPGPSGFDFLLWARRHDAFRAIPIVVLSSSNLECDRELAARLGAADYLVKAAGFQELVDRISHTFKA